MKKLKTTCRWLGILFVLLVLCRSGQAQGFINLNFEGATIPNNPTYSDITATNLFPNWTVASYYLVYNGISLSGGSISILSTNSFSPIQGKYYVLFAGGQFSNYGSISLSQTGQIPFSAQSIIFWGSMADMQVTFNGQPLDFLVTGSTANYNIYTADISTYAGQTGQLLFTVPVFGGNATLDNIQFSPSPVPEPSALGLSVLGGLFLAWRRRSLRFSFFHQRFSGTLRAWSRRFRPF